MAQTVRDVMTTNPVTLAGTAAVVEAARAMRDHDIGAIVVTRKHGTPMGLVTDRDLAVRAVAEGLDPNTTSIGDVCSGDLTSVSPETPVEQAVEKMRSRAIRRLPVMENGRVVGILSLGDLAIERDPRSALAGISSAPSNS